MFGKINWRYVLSMVSLALFVYLTTLIPYLLEVYDLVRYNEGGKLVGMQQFAGIIVVGINAGFLIGGLVIALFGAVIPLLPDDMGEGTGSTGPR